MTLSDDQMAELKSILNTYEAALRPPKPRAQMAGPEREEQASREDTAWKNLVEATGRLGIDPTALDQAVAQVTNPSSKALVRHPSSKGAGSNGSRPG